ncbi:MAG: HNH endonuclease [Acidimicrobiia bacterium]
MEGLTPDLVEQALLAEEAKIAKSRASQLQLILVADAMQLHTADGCRSLSEWVAGRLDVSNETASTLVRTARRIAGAPDVVRSLSSGAITFDRAEATSRIPEEAQEHDLLGHDIAGLRRIAARYRRADRVDDRHSHISQRLTLQPNLDESRWDLWGQLDGYGGAVVSKVLTEEADLLEQLPDGTVPGLGYRRAVALTRICEERKLGSGTTPLISVFVDERAIEVENGTAIGPGILDKIACVGSLEVIKVRDGEPLSIGRRSRVISKRLRRFVMHRDGGCTAEGCSSRYRLQPHHIVPWSEGGPTDADNLTTLCWFHHHVVVHGWGYQIDPKLGAGRIRFLRSDRGPP